MVTSEAFTAFVFSELLFLLTYFLLAFSLAIHYLTQNKEKYLIVK
jgi:hypothetical protein